MKVVSGNYPAPAFAMTARALSSISDLIVHHTAGALGQTPLAIDAEHRAIGDAMVAYNFIITPDGTTYDGRPLVYVPAAAFGRNAQSVNVCLVGNFQSDDAGYTGPPTSAQLQALCELAAQLHLELPSIVRTIGHRDVAALFYPSDEENYSTACPGDMLYRQLPVVRAYCTAQRRRVA